MIRRPPRSTLLSLHDALPILKQRDYRGDAEQCGRGHGNRLLRESAVAHFAPLVRRVNSASAAGQCSLWKINRDVRISPASTVIHSIVGTVPAGVSVTKS